MCKFQLFSNNPHVPLFGWVDYTCGKGKRARDTVFISTVVLFRLINTEFHKKIGSFGAGAAPDVYLKEKPRGGFLSASSHWFSRVGVNQTLPLPLLTPKLPQPFSLCPILIQHLPILRFGICFLITIENRQIIFVFFCNGQHQLRTLHICAVQLFEIFFDKSTWQAQHLSAVSLG